MARPLRRYHDSDSAPSISPSPDPDSFIKTFDFSRVDPTNLNEMPHLTAALQTEREFIDFMFSLPQIQKEAIEKGQGRVVSEPVVQHEEEQLSKETSEIIALHFNPLIQPIEKKVPMIHPTPHTATTRVGLDHLDNLCRMMEQLTELKEQNSRLQRRVQYLEDLKTLQEMHRDMQESMVDRPNTLWLTPSNLSDSELRLDELADLPISGAASEDSLAAPSLVARINKQHQKDELLISTVEERRHSSINTDEFSRVPQILKDDSRSVRPIDKEKKGTKSAWGKVKNMISSTKRESVRKKTNLDQQRKTTSSSSSALRSTTNVGTTSNIDPSAASDPEEYELDYDPYIESGHMMDSTGFSWETGESDLHGDTGIWMSPLKLEESAINPSGTINGRRCKPELTITVPSNENLNTNQMDLHEIGDSYGDTGLSLHSPTNPPSNWRKVKQVFISSTAQPNSTTPPSPNKKSFDFEGIEDSDSPVFGPEISPDDLLSAHSQSSEQTPSPHPPYQDSATRQSAMHSTTGAVQKNLADLQKTLTGEFNRKIQEWEKLKNQQLFILSPTGNVPQPNYQNNEGNLPNEFKKKLHEWEKIKEKEKDRGKSSGPGRPQHTHQSLQSPFHKSHPDDTKTKKHGEDDLPPEFKKKLTEWEIGRAMVGKSQQNVEELQKNLGEEFNRKLAEWEKIKASGMSQIKTTVAGTAGIPIVQVPLNGCSGSPTTAPSMQQPITPNPVSPNSPLPGSGELTRKGSATKIKKNKVSKVDKQPLALAQNKPETIQKNRLKEFQWLEKELQKIEKEKQRLEREREKFLEREARLERMQKAMRQGPVEKKEIYIKTSTGEFRFEGISQTFTKKLYEWEERRGIRPESSTIALLDPNYQAHTAHGDDKPRSPEQVKRLIRSKSESSVADLSVPSPALPSQPSSISLHDHDQEEQNLQDTKAASEPTLTAEDAISISSKSTKLIPLKEMDENIDLTTAIVRQRSYIETQTEEITGSLNDPYAPTEITKLIDSSESEGEIRRRRISEVEECLDIERNEQKDIQRSNSVTTEASYRSLLHENMTLLARLRKQEDVCRALETKMGDIDTKMDNVADQHLKTLEKLHRQVIIMKGNQNIPSTLASVADNEALVEQLKEKITDLENRGEFLMAEKEQLEMAFKLHKEQESAIAESLVLRIRELQDAGAEVNIQDSVSETPLQEIIYEKPDSSNMKIDENYDGTENKIDKDNEEPKPPKQIDGDIAHNRSTTDTQSSMDMSKEYRNSNRLLSDDKKIRRKRRKKEDIESKDEDEEDDNSDDLKIRDYKDQKRKRKTPPKKVQKLHNLTGDLLFQAKRLEQALITKHNLFNEQKTKAAMSGPGLPRHRSLRGRSSLRLAGDVLTNVHLKRGHKVHTDQRTWSSIETLDTSQLKEETGEERKSIFIESQDILAMNAELSRMARELRSEMTKMWSFRDSTSPESMVSDCGEEHIKRNQSQEMTPQEHAMKTQLEAEAREVFQSIMSLQKLSSESSSPRVSKKSGKSSPSSMLSHATYPQISNSQRSSPSRRRTISDNINANFEWTLNDDIVYDDNVTEKTPCSFYLCDDSPEISEKPWFNSVSKTPYIDQDEGNNWLDDWSKPEDKLTEDFENKDDWLSGWEEPNTIKKEHVCDTSEDYLDIKLPGASGTTLNDLVKTQMPYEDENICKFYRSYSPRSHSPVDDSSGNESSAETKLRNEVKRVFENKEMNYSELLPADDNFGTWKTQCTTSTNRSGEHILSSSFEWELEDNNKVTTPYQCFIEGASNNDKTRCHFSNQHEYMSNGHDSSEPKNDSISNYITEVFTREDKDNNKTKSLKLRRVSDSQIEYDDYNQVGQILAQEFSRTIYDDEALVAGRIVRSPSFKKAEQRQRILKRKAPWNKSSNEIKESTETSSPIFVQTKRTIFTVQKEPQIPHARATPTFVGLPDIDQSNNYNFNITENSNSKTYSNSTNNKLKDNKENFEQPKIILRELKTFSIESLDKVSSDEEYRDRLTPLPDYFDKCEPIDNSNSDSNLSSAYSESCRSSNSNMTQSQTSMASPPVESKRKVLQAVNDGSETNVRNMIQAYNQRITESQELLISPFKSQKDISCKYSPSSSRKQSPSRGVINKISKNQPISNFVIKSQSATALPHKKLDQVSQNISSVIRSSSGPLLYRNFQPCGSNAVSSLRFSESVNTNIGSSMGISLHTSMENETSTDIDQSLDESSVSIHEETQTSTTTRDSSPSTKLRAVKIKKAREEFLARGVAPLCISKQQNIEIVHNETSSTNDSLGDSCDLSATTLASSTSASPHLFISESKSELRRNPSRRSNIPKKESFRRQSEGSLMDPNLPKPNTNVLKSASSGIIGFSRQRSSTPSSQRSPIRFPHLSNKRSSNIFNFFKKPKDKKSDELTAVSKLCRQSLSIHITVNDQNLPSTSHGLPQNEEALNAPKENERYRACSTLPRGRQVEHSNSSTRSCPSSPVAQHKKKASAWLAKGKKIFKTRSPSPNKK